MRIRRPWERVILKTEANPEEPSLTNFYTAPTLHIFRALLRECTYLPDPNSRRFFHEHVVSRFRAYCPRPYGDPRQSFKKTNTIIQRRPQLLKKANKSLKYLCRANHGHPRHLGKVLAMTYGRTGPRRHELLKDLKIPDSPVNTGALEDVLKQRTDPANQYVPHPSQQLLALLKSQAQRKETTFSRTTLKQSEPQIPETNAWGRPMPMKRVRNIKRRWYAEALDRVMPPLPETEWEVLRKMAIGKTPFYGTVERRGPSGERDIGLESYHSENKLSRPHDLNARYMRRLWTKIFQQCPFMRKDPTRPSGWHIIWPDLKREIEIGLDPTVFDNQSIFDGVDDGGKVRASGLH